RVLWAQHLLSDGLRPLMQRLGFLIPPLEDGRQRGRILLQHKSGLVLRWNILCSKLPEHRLTFHLAQQQRRPTPPDLLSTIYHRPPREFYWKVLAALTCTLNNS
ncbi:unnamed protein product, partial [Ectocarpus sp. 13 AM-2016]